MPYLTDEDVLKKVNYSSPLNLQITTKKFSREENEYINQAGWKIGISNNIKGKDGSIIIVDVLEIIPSQQKELSETKGKAISDYQDFLENKWLKELKQKYAVRINSQVLYSIIQ